jgi:excisionase family DNA binding protein
MRRPLAPVAQLTLDAIDATRPVGNAEISLADPLLRPEEVARLLSVKPSWVYEKVRAGELPCLRVGRHLRFTRTMVEHWPAGQR